MTALLLAPGADPKPEALPPAVKEVLDKYLTALAAKDLDAMAKLADVPWLDRDRKLVRDRAGLRGALKRVAGQLPPDQGQRKVEAHSHKKARGGIKDKAERKLLDDVLGEDGWLVSVEEDGYPLSARILLLRVKGGKAAVVAGPLKLNQLNPGNRIPEVVDRLFDKVNAFELYSLDPDDKAAGGGKGGFHGWKVLGKTEVKEAEARKRLVGALRLGAEDNFGMAAACFIPRHGVRLKDGGKTVDLVICFQCLSVQVFVDGKQAKGFLTTKDPQKEYDAVLKAAGVKLPKPAKE
jgi:hypothetical protein